MSWLRAHPWRTALLLLVLLVLVWIVWFGGIPFGEGHTE